MSNRDVHWVLVFVVKILGYIIVLNLIVLPILWVLRILNLLTLVLIYEALFISITGVFQILSSYIYRENRFPPSGVASGWFDFKRFAKLKPEERQRYRQEGKIMITVGLILLVAAITAHFFVPH